MNWIKVEDEMPPEGMLVNVICKDDAVYCAHWRDRRAKFSKKPLIKWITHYSCYCNHSDIEPIYWTPIAVSPKEMAGSWEEPYKCSKSKGQDHVDSE